MVALIARSAAQPTSRVIRRNAMSLLGILGRPFAWLAREWRLRREIRSVEGFTEAMLRDIGLGRGSIEDAVRHGRERPKHLRLR